MSKRNGDWIQTYKGIRFYPIDPRPEDILIEDIAHALSMQCRFTGHTKEFYSVAQHSVLVAGSCNPEYALWGLLHDASEAYIGDISRPFKHSLEMKDYRAVEHEIMLAVAEKFGLPYDIPENVKYTDSALCMTEAKQLLGNLIDGWSTGAEPLKIDILPWDPKNAERCFLSTFKILNQLKELVKGNRIE